MSRECESSGRSSDQYHVKSDSPPSCLIPYARVLNTTDIGCRVKRVITKDDPYYMRGTFILNNIVYDRHGNIELYIIHDIIHPIFLMRVSPEVSDGWVNLDREYE